MQTRELYINDKLIHLSEGTRIGMTYQANNIAELQNRQGNFSNTFKILMTDTNLSELDWLHIQTSSTEIPYRRNTAKYIEDGIEIVPKGEAVIKVSESKNGIFIVEISIVSGNTDPFKELGDKIVGELYEGVDPHEWNFENVRDSRQENNFFMYPFIDWRTDADTFFTAANVDPATMLPTLRVPDLLDKIEADIDYEFIGDYINSDAHQNMILTPSHFELTDETVEALAAASWRTPEDSFIVLANNYANSSVSIPQGSGNTSLSMLPAHNDWDVGSGFLFTEYYAPQNEVANLKYTATVGIDWFATQNYGLFQSPEEKNVRTYARLWGWDTIGAPVLLASQVVIDISTTPYLNGQVQEEGQFVVSIETGEIQLNAGWVYYPEIECVFRRHSNADTGGAVYSKGSRFQKIPTKALVYGNDIYFKDLYRMTIKDVFKDLMNKRGVIMQTDSYQRKIQLNFFQDVVDNIASAIDWSGKVDVRQSKMVYKFGKYGQTNYFRFKESDQVTEELGDYYFNIDDQTLAEEVNVVQFKHPATEQENRYLGYNIPTIEGVDSLYKWNEPDWRLLQMDIQDTDFDVTYNDGTDSEALDTDIPFCKFEGMDILAPEYYSALEGILDKTKVIVLMIDLNAVDIQALDFVIPRYIGVPELNIDGYFYINEISNYKKGKTAVQLIRL